MKDKDTILLESAYELVLEQPHITVNNQTFDLEIELFKNNPQSLIEKLNKVLSLDPIVMWERKPDRQPVEFRFNTINDAKTYWGELKRNNTFRMFLNYWVNSGQIDLSSFLAKIKFK